MRLITGTRLGRYEIRAKIGEGGMGEVYLAQDTKLDRKVALKILPAEVSADRNRMSRFVQEAKVASGLNHPNIITIHEIGEGGSSPTVREGVHFIATEFIDGETLRERMRKASMKLGEVLDVAAQIASALSAAHAAGIVHRDIKPENIMLRRDGIVKVLDFGLAKLTERLPADSVDTEAPTRAVVNTDPGVVMGTAIYMSPEQARGMAVDARTDIFSFGVLIYEMVTGGRPFAGVNISEVLAAILSEKEPPPLARFSREVPAELERIVSKALRKNKDERYQTIKDLLIDLKDVKHDLEFEARLERTSQRDAGSGSRAERSSSPTALGTAPTQTAPTGKDSPIPTVSSAKILLGEIKRHRLGVTLTLAALVITAVAGFFYLHRQPALTDKDTVLIADFENTTGDPVFDGTLKDALAIQLEQSPFMNIFPDEHVRDALRFMDRPPDQRVTKEVAREICEREGLKALLSGSITSLGRDYVLTVEAINARTGDVVAREQVEADGKEQVLKALGRLATSLRPKLGESLSSIQKFDRPAEQVTTASLQALKAFSLGAERQHKGQVLEAIPFYKQAIELDPNFALAHANLAGALAATFQRDEADAAAARAFSLRERVSERERYIITVHYYYTALGDIENAIEQAELWKRTYPRDPDARFDLSFGFNQLGQFEQAAEEAREAIELDQKPANGYGNLGVALIRLNRFAEAREVYQRAIAQNLDSRPIRFGLFQIAMGQEDAAAIQEQIDWANGKPEAYEGFNWQVRREMFFGRLRKARDFHTLGSEMARRQNLPEVPADFASIYAENDAFIGTCRYVREDVASVLAVSHSLAILYRSAMSLALCGEVAQAETTAKELEKRMPKSTYANMIFLPAVRAAIALKQGRPEDAVQTLQSVSRYAPGSFLWHSYLLGLAYLEEKRGPEAMVEFQRVLDHRGENPTSVIYPLAHVGLARSAVLSGDSARARKAYESFFALWKDADPDIPILIEAKKEYAKLT